MYLTKESKELIYFFIKNKIFNNDKQSLKTKTILRKLYNEILEAYNYCKKYIHYKITIKKISSPTQITRSLNYNVKSFPDNVRNHINKSSVSEVLFTFSLNQKKIKVYFILENDNIEMEMQKYNTYMERLSIWLYMLNMYSSNKCANTLAVYLYFTSLEKNLPNSNIYILDENNVNTAFTTSCPKHAEIVIFRKQEWFKVFIHESFHCFGLDFSMMNNDEINNCILNIFKVKSDVNSYEAYTEFWAEIINVLFCSFYSIKNKNDINEFLSNSEFFINLEITYSFFQMVKIFDFMGLTYRDLYSKTKYSSIIRENLFKENTNVLSYYIIKCVLMNNYQGFFDWCNKNNWSLLNFKKTLDNQNQFCKFIEKNYKTQKMLNNIWNYANFFIKTKKKHMNNKFILSNLRMSICELS